MHVNPILSLLHGDLVIRSLHDLNLIRRWSNPREHDWQEAEAVKDSQDNNEEVHAEVVQLEEGRWAKASTKMPSNFVEAMPTTTEEPILFIAFMARTYLVPSCRIKFIPM